MKVKPVKRPRVGRPSIEELDELIGLAISDNPVCITHCMNRWWPMYSEATEAMDISEAFKRMRVHLETKMRSNPDILLCYPDIANKVIWENQRVLAFRQGIMAHAIRDEQHVIWEASFITQETDCRIAIKEVKISLMQTLRIEVDLDKKIARIIESLWIYPDQQDFADSFHYAEDPAITLDEFADRHA